MSKSLFVVGLALGLAMLSGAADAAPLKGVWSSGNASSLEILSAKKLEYCFLEQCTTQKYKGKADATVSFSWGADHHYKFTKTATGYSGIYNDDKDMTIDVK